MSLASLVAFALLCRVHVPEIVHPLSSHRVLTMEFIDGVGVTDKEALARLGVAPRSLAQLVAETFSEMIFIHGDVHCDPHAANMVRKGGAGWEFFPLSRCRCLLEWS